MILLAPPHVSDSLSALGQRLSRIIERHRLVDRLAAVCNFSEIELQVGCDSELIWSSAWLGRSAAPRGMYSHTVPIRFEGQVIGQVQATGRRAMCRKASPLLAAWIEDLLLLEHEIDSLTHEIVHSYEELHVLYDLGTALGGVLNVEAACALIAEAVLAPLNAAETTVTLLRHGEEYIAARAVHPCPERKICGDRASAPLQVNGVVIGYLHADGKLDAPEFVSGDFKLLDGVAAIAAPAIRNAQLYEIARVQADTDVVTGVYNHRVIQARFDEELERAQRYTHPMSVLLIEIDEINLFRDVYGSAVGEQLLVLLASCLRSLLRSSDIAGAYGDDKLLVLAPETDLDGAMALGQRLLDALKLRDIVIDAARLTASASIGVATYPHHSLTRHGLIASAEQARIEARSSGGGTVRCVSVSQPDPLALDGGTFSVLEGLVRAVDAKDHYTQEHSEVVTDAALLLARHLHLADEAQRALRIAGLLHDVGKIGIPDHILKKPGKLTADEYAIMQQHVVLSELIIKGVPHLTDVLDAVAHHHERYDGRGYPYRKSGEAIPLLGRIMALADAYSAMCMDRPYRKGLRWAEVRAELERGRGTQFDPELTDIFVAAMEQEQELQVPMQELSTIATEPSIESAQARLDQHSAYPPSAGSAASAMSH